MICPFRATMNYTLKKVFSFVLVIWPTWLLSKVIHLFSFVHDFLITPVASSPSILVLSCLSNSTVLVFESCNVVWHISTRNSAWQRTSCREHAQVHPEERTTQQQRPLTNDAAVSTPTLLTQEPLTWPEPHQIPQWKEECYGERTAERKGWRYTQVGELDRRMQP